VNIKHETHQALGKHTTTKEILRYENNEEIKYLDKINNNEQVDLNKDD
jgi:hypothetical protein